MHSGRDLSQMKNVFLKCADSTDEDTWKELNANEIVHLEVEGNIAVFCSPPFGIIAGTNLPQPLDDDENEGEEAEEDEDATSNTDHDADEALKARAVSAFANAMHQHLPDKTIVVLHLSWKLFPMYNKKMVKHGWSMVNHPIFVTSPTAAPRGFQTTSMSANVDTFFVYYKASQKYKPSIYFLKNLKDGDAAAKSLYNSLVRCGHIVKNKIPPGERCHMVRHVTDQNAGKMQTAHTLKINKQLAENKIDKAQATKHKKHPNLVP